jgi:hypothetical protein
VLRAFFASPCRTSGWEHEPLWKRGGLR